MDPIKELKIVDAPTEILFAWRWPGPLLVNVLLYSWCQGRLVRLVLSLNRIFKQNEDAKAQSEKGFLFQIFAGEPVSIPAVDGCLPRSYPPADTR